MRKLLIAVAMLSCLSVSAIAQELPKTLELPTPLVEAFRQYMSARPYNEVRDGLASLDACITAQVPQGGAIRDSGQCPAVSVSLAARRAQEAELAKLKTPPADATKVP